MARQLRPEPGDVVEIDVDGKKAALQYIGRDERYGDVVRVLGFLELGDENVSFDERVADGYVAYYPLCDSVRAGRTRVVGRCMADLKLPERVRKPVFRPGGGIGGWIVVEGDSQRSVEALSAAERCLPIQLLFSHASMVRRLRKGWRPEDEG